MYFFIFHVTNILCYCVLVMLIRLGLNKDAVPDVPMRLEEKTTSQTERAYSRTVRQVVRGE